MKASQEGSIADAGGAEGVNHHGECFSAHLPWSDSIHTCQYKLSTFESSGCKVGVKRGVNAQHAFTVVICAGKGCQDLLAVVGCSVSLLV